MCLQLAGTDEYKQMESEELRTEQDCGKCNCLCVRDDDAIGDYSLSSQDYTRRINPSLL